MMGLTGLVSSSQLTQVSCGKPNLYMLSLPAVKAMVYLNTEGNFEFLTKHREARPLHQFVLAACSSEPCSAEQRSARGGYLLAALLALLHLFWP